jgi:hypothetical protein
VFENVPVRISQNSESYEGEGKYGSNMDLLDEDGSISDSRMATVISTRSRGDGSKQRREWNVWFTPKP